MTYSTMIYNQNNLTSLDWPVSEEGDYARRYLMPLIENAPHTYIRNAYTTLAVLRVGDTILPITFGDYHPDNTYVCSPYNHYIVYGQEELRNLKNPSAESLLRLVLVPIAWYFRRHEFDRVVFVNNWLLSTNLYPQINDEQIRAALTFLVEAFPDRAIVFRSVDGYGNQRLLDALLAEGCRMIFSRQVYYQDVESAYVQNKRQYKSDLKIYAGTEYRVVDGQELRDNESIERIVALYNDLYLHKYSFYNPQFSPAFIRLALDKQLLNIKAFQEPQSQRIDAVMGNYSRQAVITAPLFGYDTKLPQKLALYRLLSTLGSLDGQEQKKVVNMSAGVGHFKRLRGGIPVMEYNAVYDMYLPATRRRPWSLLKAIMDRIAMPIIKKYGF